MLVLPNQLTNKMAAVMPPNAITMPMSMKPTIFGIPMWNGDNDNHVSGSGSANNGNGNTNGAYDPTTAPNATTTGANEFLEQKANGRRGDDDDSSDNNRDNRIANEETEEYSHFTIIIDLSDFNEPNVNIWGILNESRRQITNRIRENHFNVDLPSMRTTRALRFDGYFVDSALDLVTEEDQIDFVHRSLARWLMTMLDMRVQNSPIRIPWLAGAWGMKFLRL